MKEGRILAGLTYKDSGVDIAAGEEFVHRIQPLVTRTKRSGSNAELGGFGGLFDLQAAGYRDPLLVAATDGVGTKVDIAAQYGMHRGLGIDLVAMCVNDLLAQGAEPLFFLDYWACGRLDVKVGQEIIDGVVDGCCQAGCALIGGETAEMPGVYGKSRYDLAGFAVGALERADAENRVSPQEGDVAIGFASSGIHANGFSFIRRLLADKVIDPTSRAPFDQGRSLLDYLLAPTRIYIQICLPLIQNRALRAVAHITGGGLPGNIGRALPAEMAVELTDYGSDQPLFRWLALQSGAGFDEMLQTFNLGVGMVGIASPSDAEAICANHVNAWQMGRVIKRVSSALVYDADQGAKWLNAG